MGPHWTLNLNIWNKWNKGLEKRPIASCCLQNSILKHGYKSDNISKTQVRNMYFRMLIVNINPSTRLLRISITNETMRPCGLWQKLPNTRLTPPDHISGAKITLNQLISTIKLGLSLCITTLQAGGNFCL